MLKLGQKGRHTNYKIFVQIDGLYLLHIDKFNGT